MHKLPSDFPVENVLVPMVAIALLLWLLFATISLGYL